MLLNQREQKSAMQEHAFDHQGDSEKDDILLGYLLLALRVLQPDLSINLVIANNGGNAVLQQSAQDDEKSSAENPYFSALRHKIEAIKNVYGNQAQKYGNSGAINLEEPFTDEATLQNIHDSNSRFILASGAPIEHYQAWKNFGSNNSEFNKKRTFILYGSSNLNWLMTYIMNTENCDQLTAGQRAEAFLKSFKTCYCIETPNIIGRDATRSIDSRHYPDLTQYLSESAQAPNAPETFKQTMASIKDFNTRIATKQLLRMAILAENDPPLLKTITDALVAPHNKNISTPAALKEYINDGFFTDLSKMSIEDRTRLTKTLTAAIKTSSASAIKDPFEKDQKNIDNARVANILDSILPYFETQILCADPLIVLVLKEILESERSSEQTTGPLLKLFKPSALEKIDPKKQAMTFTTATDDASPLQTAFLPVEVEPTDKAALLRHYCDNARYIERTFLDLLQQSMVLTPEPQTKGQERNSQQQFHGSNPYSTFGTPTTTPTPAVSQTEGSIERDSSKGGARDPNFNAS